MSLTQEQINALLLPKLAKLSNPVPVKRAAQGAVRTVEGPFPHPNMLFVTKFIKAARCKDCDEDTIIRMLGIPYCQDCAVKHMNTRLEQMRLDIRVVIEVDEELF